MSRTGALLLIAAGSISGLYVFGFPPSDTATDLADITRISAAPDRNYVEPAGVRTFAPTSPAFNTVRPVRQEAAGASPPRPGTWTTVVISGQTVLSPVKSTRAADAQTRLQLARDIQQELKRAGCYDGAITGAWNGSSRRAMSAFLDRANAVLPFKDPDYVLLALVQNHREISCSAACENGQVMQEGGRCVPEAIVAQAAKRSRLADGQSQFRAPDDHQNVTASTPEILPWLNTAAASPTSSDNDAAPRPAPLPGRMSIGGPIEAATGAPPEATGTGSDGASSGTSSTVAALQADPDSDGLSGNATASGDAPPIAITTDSATHKSHHSESDGRRRYDSYASMGRRRHGDPRPGTARFNLMQSLGGVY
jgi:hypothetical protein